MRSIYIYIYIYDISSLRVNIVRGLSSLLSGTVGNNNVRPVARNASESYTGGCRISRAHRAHRCIMSLGCRRVECQVWVSNSFFLGVTPCSLVGMYQLQGFTSRNE